MNPTQPPGPVFGVPLAAAPPAAPRDRLIVHLAWEGVLLFFAMVLLVALLVTTPSQLLANLFPQAGISGLLAAAVAFSLRTGAPNLAAGGMAVLTSALIGVFVVQAGMPPAAAFALALVLVTVAGLVLGALAAVLSVPAWAVTLLGGAVLEWLALGLVGGRGVPVPSPIGDPGWLWFLLFALVSIGGGLLWLVPGVRAALSGARRPVADPGRWAGLAAGAGALAGIAVSGLLAAVAGLALVTRLHGTTVGSGQSLLLSALAAALLGGTSLFGRRAGVAGTFLAVLIVTSVTSLLLFHGAPTWMTGLVTAVLGLLGLGAVRLLESLQPVAAPVQVAFAPPPPPQSPPSSFPQSSSPQSPPLPSPPPPFSSPPRGPGEPG
ncbi:ribose/xylose/arabinose/galactoside ABC-type transport system permease subunit [Thermocatellispora tengchongensis]|uniref:Ribose/xylose/arabinose/galactoside ABC-type transport system permease subunit n=1 Tax=Thermocatellispora tengchongensis TaxID=1073253 RepID=A0A840P1G7_9ACTN|nr:ABC transporter permease [Thermocatellispora tengchongensis]MBB5131310.1 ribose/xylose/arabinose/galactoside ABC-type transport system permease subunit [Thermocatellispora tengchongensis]